MVAAEQLQPGLHVVDDAAARAADPDRERVVTVTLVFPGGLEVSYQVRGPVRVELEHQVVEVHASDRGLFVGDDGQPIGSIQVLQAIHSAARAGTVANRERQISALLEMVVPEPKPRGR